jgi:hypothetical protein
MLTATTARRKRHRAGGYALMVFSIKASVCRALALGFAATVASTATLRLANADPIPPGWQSSNMEPVGYSDLGGRSGAFKLTIKRVGDKWYLFMGHLWHYGFSIVDVSDVKNPRYVKFVEMPTNNWTIQLTHHDNILIAAMEKQALAWGGDPSKPFSEGAILFDISDPENPRELSRWHTGATGTHRNSYPGGKYAFMSAATPGSTGNILIILDVSDPKAPKEVGRWHQPGQMEGEPVPAAPRGFHGPANLSPDGKSLVMAYSPSVVNLDISDVAHPRVIGQLQMSPPFLAAGSQSLHTSLPLWDRGLIYANSEASAERCKEGLNWAGIIDNRNPANPQLMSLFPLPRPPKDAPYKNFCEKGGRFGPHNTNQEIHLPDVEKPGNLIYLTYFNAGLRVFDIKDPIQPTETGWFMPPQPQRRAGPQPPNDLVSQTEDVLVDTRGNIYIDDKHWGLWILRYTGEDQPAPTAK